MKPVNLSEKLQSQVHIKITYSLRRDIVTRVRMVVRESFVEKIDDYITDVMYINLYEKMDRQIKKDLNE